VIIDAEGDRSYKVNRRSRIEAAENKLDARGILEEVRRCAPSRRLRKSTAAKPKPTPSASEQVPIQSVNRKKLKLRRKLKIRRQLYVVTIYCSRRLFRKKLPNCSHQTVDVVPRASMSTFNRVARSLDVIRTDARDSAFLSATAAKREKIFHR
jgi:hypothetical protein